MTIQVDSREKAHAIEKILSTFRQCCVKYYISKMWVGDYGSLDNPRVAVDRKQSLLEVCSNMCQQHERFRDECVRAKEAGIHLIILVEHGRGILCIDDVEDWKNPRLKRSPQATTGKALASFMRTMAEKYDIEWVFCEKPQTGKEIIRLLG